MNAWRGKEFATRADSERSRKIRAGFRVTLQLFRCFLRLILSAILANGLMQ
jgi:hypothetical protein